MNSESVDKNICDFTKWDLNKITYDVMPALGVGIVLGATAVLLATKSEIVQKVLKAGEHSLEISLKLAAPIAAVATALYAHTYSHKVLGDYQKSLGGESIQRALNIVVVNASCLVGLMAGATTWNLADVFIPSQNVKKLTTEELKSEILKAAQWARPGSDRRKSSVEVLGEFAISAGVDLAKIEPLKRQALSEESATVHDAIDKLLSLIDQNLFT